MCEGSVTTRRLIYIPIFQKNVQRTLSEVSGKQTVGHVIDIDTDEEITIIDLTYKIAEKMGLPKPEIKFEGYRSSDPERRILNTEKIRTRTDWAPIITLDKGLEMCVASIEK